ncbi:hypothetical protein HN51_034783, partial [Arachis hypogaea]
IRLDSGLFEVPDSISALQCLQTLEIYNHNYYLGAVLWLSIFLPSGLWSLKQLRHLNTNGIMILRGHHGSKEEDEIMWNLQTIYYITFNRQIACLLEKGRFPKLQKLGVHISWIPKDNVHELLSSLQRLSSHLNKLKLFIEWKQYKVSESSNLKHMEWHIGCKPIELLQTLQQFSNLSTLKVIGALDLAMCDIEFPPCITKLTLTGISFMNDDGINAIANLTRLQRLSLHGALEFHDSFEINCSAGSFKRLQDFLMLGLQVHS